MIANIIKSLGKNHHQGFNKEYDDACDNGFFPAKLISENTRRHFEQENKKREYCIQALTPGTKSSPLSL
jgi:hypothetical protein